MTAVNIVRRGVSPRVVQAKVRTASGRTATFSGWSLRGTLGLRDTWFSGPAEPRRRAVRRRAAVAALAATAAAAAAGLASAGTAAAADPILPLSEVRPGMVGQARTVVRGTDIVTFPVTVIDVQQTSDAPGGALVIVRAEGPLIEETGGVAEGMSGSPVYVTGADGVARVMGAIAYGSGDQANVIVGVTPIEQMIDSSSGQRANARVAGAAKPLRLVRDRGAARAAERRDPGAPGPLSARAVDDRRRLPPPGRRAPAELARSGVRLTSIGPRTLRPRGAAGAGRVDDRPAGRRRPGARRGRHRDLR